MMKRSRLLLFFCFHNFLLAEGQGFVTPPPAAFTPKEPTSYLPHIPKVNVITGEYCEEEIDFVLAGIEPLSIRRFYNHLGHKDQAYGHWRINPEALMLFGFSSSYHEIFSGIGDENGSFLICQKQEQDAFSFDGGKNPNFTHFGTGQKHPLNVHFSREKVTPRKNEYYWKGVIEDGTGRRRLFKTELGLWDYEYQPVYQAFIKEDRKPNGNVLYYTYEDFNKKWPRDGHYKELNTYYILRSLSAYSASGTFLGSIQLNYKDHYRKDCGIKNRYIQEIEILGSDGRKAIYTNQIRTVQHHRSRAWWNPLDEDQWEKIDVVLERVESPSKPNQEYNYRWESRKTYFDHPYMFSAGQSENRKIETTYDLPSKKVTAQYAPLGPKGEMLPIARYLYNEDHTIVYDGENNKTLFRFNKEKRITAIERYQGEQLLRTERTEWECSTGNLLKYQIEDARGTPLLIKQYTYDTNHNAIEETVGNGREHYTVCRTYSNDGFNLKLSEKDPQGRLTRFTYVPGTNLLASELTSVNGTICKRTFHTYDDGAVCIKTIVDDGKSTDPEDLNVTYRKITCVTPKRSHPCFGLPEVVEEKTIDATGNEILLSKVIYTYSPSGQVVQEDHYDAEDRYRYSLKSTYDDKERLSSATHALGHTTHYTYDANNNLISISGPRADQHKAITYDMMNRPIKVTELQTDGTHLTTEKKYDKLGRIIATIDECGFETQYVYDALGHITSIHYPDGAVEYKEYDPLGNVIQETDANGYVTHKKYNFRGQPLEIDYPDGSSEHFSYSPKGNLLTYTDKNGSITLYRYDSFDHVIESKLISPSGDLLKTTSATFNAFLQLTSTKPEGATTLFTYDHAGRKIREETEGNPTLFAYDSLGRLSTTQTLDCLHITTYDDLGQPIEERVEDLEHTLIKQKSYAYDEMGNRIQTITEKGISETLYNSRGLPLKKIDPFGHTTTFRYSYHNGLTKIITHPDRVQTIRIYDCRGNEVEVLKKNKQSETIFNRHKIFDNCHNVIQETHSLYSGTTLFDMITNRWSYGPLNRIEKQIESDQKETHSLYDTLGRLSKKIKPDGTTLFYEYDAAGRLARTYSTDFDYHYSYDKEDRILSVSDTTSNTQTTRTYDMRGHLIQETLANGFTFKNTYDIQGRRIHSHLPEEHHITYSYRACQLYSISKDAHTHFYQKRDLQGQIIETTLPNNLGHITIERDALSRPLALDMPYFHATCSYNPLGHLSRYHYTDSLGSEEIDYTYDDLEQLTREQEHTYTHDSLNNRLKKDTHAYTLNTLCQIIDDGKNTYEYDQNGNLLSDGTHHFTYDTQDRLITIEKGNTRIAYTYDPFHRRLSKTITTKNKQKEKHLYLWDFQNEIGATNARGEIQELRILGEGLQAEIGAAVLIEYKKKTYVPLHDHRGNLIALIDLKSNRQVSTYRYTAFGEEETQGLLIPWRFSSKRLDPETGYLYFGRRYYSPEIGRWITPDPQGFADGPNLYAYLHNNPLIYCDPFGLFTLRHAGSLFINLGHKTCTGIEWAGANLIPLPGIQGLIESLGRWGAGGEFFGESRYRSNANEVITIPGKQIPGTSHTYINGMLTTRKEAIEQTEQISKNRGGIEVDLLYNASRGFMMDLISCGLAKLGALTPFEQMAATYYKDKLREDPHHKFLSIVHSRGGIRMMNTGKFLCQQERDHIHVIPYGSATLIPKGYFGSATNIVSPFDPIAMTNPLAYAVALFSNQIDITFVKPATHNPFKEHSLSGKTYSRDLEKRGGKFVKEHEEYFE